MTTENKYLRIFKRAPVTATHYYDAYALYCKQKNKVIYVRTARGKWSVTKRLITLENTIPIKGYLFTRIYYSIKRRFTK